VVVLGLVAAGVAWWLARPGTDLERAVALAPADSERLAWTNWSAVRAELDADLSGSSQDTAVADFLDAGYEADLTSTSALLGSSAVLHQRFGFSPATLEWELLSQSAQGAVVIMGLPESADLDELADGFERLGYQRPESEDGVWRGGAELLAGIDPVLTPELQYLAIDPDERVLRASDNAEFLEQAAGDGDRDPEPLADAVEATDEPLSAVVYGQAYTCQQLAMATAGRADQARGEQLVAQAGEVNPVTAYAMSAQPDGGIRVVMTFESDDQARANADSRAALAAGPAPGQGGDFGDRFAVDQVSAEGPVVTMELDPVEGEYVLSDLSSGPVLFATC
jgi:hypothetical protein